MGGSRKELEVVLVEKIAREEKKCESYFEIMRERHNIYIYVSVCVRGKKRRKTEELKKEKDLTALKKIIIC